MVPTRSAGRRSQRPVPYDPELMINWTLAKLREECTKRGIQFPSAARRALFMRYIRENDAADNIGAARGSARRPPLREQDAQRNVNTAAVDTDEVPKTIWNSS